MLGVGPLFLLSISLFIVCASVFAFEQRRGSRLFLASARTWLDGFFERVTEYLARQITYIGRHTIKLSWYYGIHKMLRLALGGLVKAYDYLETLFMKNRDRARTLRLEKRNLKQADNHLGQMAEHKASTALTASEKKRLLEKKLERG